MLIILYIWKTGCPSSEQNLVVWREFIQHITNFTWIECIDFEVSKSNEGEPIITYLNSLVKNPIIDTKPAIIFYYTNGKSMYLNVNRPASVEGLLKAVFVIKNIDNEKANILDNLIINSDTLINDRRKQIDKLENECSVVLIKFDVKSR